MPLEVMEKLTLDIISLYKYFYSFDSKRIQCSRMMKYLVVRIMQMPRKIFMMDVVIADVPPTYGSQR